MSKSKSRSQQIKPKSALSRNWLAYSVAAVIVIIAGYLVYTLAFRNTAAGGAAASGTKQWSSVPPMSIDVNRQYTAHIQTVKGTIDVQLLPKAAPIAVNSFVFLARQHYFDGVTFHRVIPGFMAQGGDPTGTGSGGPGYSFDNEVSSGLTFDSAGIVAMANTGQPNSNGSQFFITYAPQPSLNGGYTIFGKVLSGMNVAQALTPRDPQQNPNFTGDVINTITIDEQ
jgi:cyclophilin family peptidyl-prolyl cis-trans isomerase